MSWLITLLGVLGWGLGILFVLILFRISSSEDRAARHAEKNLDPFSDVMITVTRTGA